MDSCSLVKVCGFVVNLVPAEMEYVAKHELQSPGEYRHDQGPTHEGVHKSWEMHASSLQYRFTLSLTASIPYCTHPLPVYMNL